ncbi:hypothetical protein ACLESD_35215 [Pyxidicoccus sp. 3LFB2]
MSKLLKSLLVATAFLTLAPTTASARPEDCDELCTDWQNASCSAQCLWLGRIITCGDYDGGVCSGAQAEPSASVSQDEAEQSESQHVCGEQSQPAALSASAGR